MDIHLFTVTVSFREYMYELHRLYNQCTHARTETEWNFEREM